jgi:hypothetical protein
MWMNEIEPVIFEYFNKNYPIKDIRDIPEYANFVTVDVSIESMLDEICTRNDVYGENTEDQSYKIFEANIVKITDADFSLSRIKTLRIPMA